MVKKGFTLYKAECMHPSVIAHERRRLGSAWELRVHPEDEHKLARPETIKATAVKKAAPKKAAAPQKAAAVEPAYQALLAYGLSLNDAKLLVLRHNIKSPADMLAALHDPEKRAAILDDKRITLNEEKAQRVEANLKPAPSPEDELTAALNDAAKDLQHIDGIGEKTAQVLIAQHAIMSSAELAAAIADENRAAALIDCPDCKVSADDLARFLRQLNAEAVEELEAAAAAEAEKAAAANSDPGVTFYVGEKHDAAGNVLGPAIYLNEKGKETEDIHAAKQFPNALDCDTFIDTLLTDSLFKVVEHAYFTAETPADSAAAADADDKAGK